MCSIMGYCDVCAAFSDFQKGFLKTVSRGPDDSRIVDTGKGLLGFHRLSIMGLTPSGMQPFERDGSYVVCNGEIYGFEKLKKELEKKYEFVMPSILQPVSIETISPGRIFWSREGMPWMTVSFTLIHAVAGKPYR